MVPHRLRWLLWREKNYRYFEEKAPLHNGSLFFSLLFASMNPLLILCQFDVVARDVFSVNVVRPCLYGPSGFHAFCILHKHSGSIPF